MTSSNADNPIFLQQIISRYETEEDDFLREIESMQQCANTDTSDDYQDESPVLGTLCSLVSEITNLRKQNRQLRRRLIVSSSPSPVRSLHRNSLMHRMSAAFLDSKERIFKSTSQSSSDTNGSKKKAIEIQVRARERMSSPPHKNDLTMSSYSTDMSCDTFSSSYSQRPLQKYYHRQRKVPPLVLPELSDSDIDFGDNTTPDFDRNVNDECAEQDETKSYFSNRTSASSTSASSCAEVSDVMTASRTSILNFFGFLSKKDKCEESSSFSNLNPLKTSVKKRKRKVSENEGVERLDINPVLLGGSSPNIKGTPGSNATKPARFDDAKLSLRTTPASKHVSKSLKNVAAELQVKRQSRFFDDDSEVGFDDLRKKGRPQSAIFLDPGEIMPKSKLPGKIKSTKSISSRETSASRSTFAMEEDIHCLREENSLLRNEVQLLKTRNNRLIDQLREKSMQYSRLQGQLSDLEEKQQLYRQKMQLNEALDKICLRDRLLLGSQAVMENVEEKLTEFDYKLQTVRSEALENQKQALDTASHEQAAYQAQLEQIEHLQRENINLLQASSADLATKEKMIKQRLELMPSYDAMYSFAMGIVRKLSQLRQCLLEKTSLINQTEFELMHVQSSLLVAQAQVERLRHQVHALRKTERRKRPASFSGEDLLGNTINPTLNFYLPFKEFGARIGRKKRCKNNNIDTLVEVNEQNIETEFLRLFDYARTLSKICSSPPPIRDKPLNRETNIVYQNAQGKSIATPVHSPLLIERHRMQGNQVQTKNFHICPAKENQQFSNRRPISMVETSKDHKFSGSIRKFGEDMHKVQADIPPQKPYSSFSNDPRLRPGTNRIPTKHSGHVKAIVSSLQDVRHAAHRSPSTTPIMGERLLAGGSPSLANERRLVKQSSLQNSSMHRDNDYPYPIYDCPPKHSESPSTDYGGLAASARTSISRMPSFEKKSIKLHSGMNGQHLHSAYGRFVAHTPPHGPTDSPNLKNQKKIVNKEKPYATRNGGSGGQMMAPTTSPLMARRHLQPPQSLQQAVHQFPFYHEQTINEEDEPRSLSISEASMTTTIERCNLPDPVFHPSLTPTPSSSRLPKPLPQIEKAKKAGSLWLSKLKIGTKKSRK